jgi:lipoprotein-anchoring transpeptidase ErfK/SrfK
MTVPMFGGLAPNDGNGLPLQTEEELGEYRSAGCVRQSPGQAAQLFEWADIGTRVVVLA